MVSKAVLEKILKSWQLQDSSVNPNCEVLAWVKERNESLVVNIRPNRLSESGFWFYDAENGRVTNQNHSFFTIEGMRAYQDGNAGRALPLSLVVL